MNRFLIVASLAALPSLALAQTPKDLARLAGVTGTSISAPYAASPVAGGAGSVASLIGAQMASVSEAPANPPSTAFAGADLARLRGDTAPAMVDVHEVRLARAGRY